LKFLSRNKFFTAIEAAGLVVSLAFVLLTGHFVWQQHGMTRNVPDYGDVYTFHAKHMGADITGMSWGFADRAKASIPEVERAASFWTFGPDSEERIDVGGQKFLVKRYMVGGDFFDIFPAEFEAGSADVLQDKDNVIVTRAFANRFGTDAEVLGKRIDDQYTVAAIIKETPNPILGDVDVIYNIDGLTNRKGNSYMMDVIPFVKVKAGTDRAALEEKADTLLARAYDDLHIRDVLEDSGVVRYDELWYTPKNTLRLQKGNLLYTRILLLITILLLISSVFNYVNLNVALSGKRAKEMATRKILGAGKNALFVSWLLESLFFTAVCFVLALLLAEGLTPWFNRILGSNLPVHISYTPAWLALYGAFVLIVSLILGIVPARLISRYPAIAVVKGTFRAKSKHVFSKVFITLQHAFSIILLSLAIVLSLQVSHMLNRPMGVDVDDVFYIDTQDDDLRWVMLKGISSLPCVERAGHSTFFPGMMEQWRTEDKDRGTMEMAVLNCDRDAFEIFGFHILEKNEEPEEGTVWITEKDMDFFGIDRNTADLGRHHIDGRAIGGILDDYATFDVLDYFTEAGSYVRIGASEEQYGLVVKTVGDHREVEKILREIYKAVCMLAYGIEEAPDFFGYIPDILSDHLAKEKQRLSLVRLFMLLGLLMAALGLVAMSSYYADESEKDIAIRKVFGSTMEGETRRTILEYLVLLGVAAVIAVPAAVRLAALMLEPYAYRVSGYGWAFAAAVGITAVIAFISIFWQALRAAKTDPASSLKKE
jgi:putative ABC transport system permease protein